MKKLTLVRTPINTLLARLNALVIARNWKEAVVVHDALLGEIRGSEIMPAWDRYPIARSYFTQVWA